MSFQQDQVGSPRHQGRNDHHNFYKCQEEDCHYCCFTASPSCTPSVPMPSAAVAKKGISFATSASTLGALYNPFHDSCREMPESERC